MRRWALALRVARREALRSKGRSALVVAMIALPVLGVTAADVVIQTSDISSTEAIERRLGAADARITVERGITHVAQAADPDTGDMTATGGGKARPRTLADVEQALGRDVEAVEIGLRFVRVATDAGIAEVELTETDLTSGLTDGLYRFDEGRVPVTPREVAINHALAERGFALGDEFAVEDGPTLTVVGIGDNTSYRSSPIAVAPPGALGPPAQPGHRTWLIDAGGPVTWSDVRALNDVGATVLSRAVLENPPADSELAPELQEMAAGGGDDALVAVIALVVAMALLEVVLLAGPAFAVIARQLQHSLALMAATGATPPQARRVVLASGLVLGAAGAGLGVGLGLLVAWLSLPLVQRFSGSWLGPYDVPWLHLLGIAGFGLLSALLAAVVPAWIASRQDVVAVLAGRRGDRRPSLRSPILGLLLVGAGVAIAAYGARQGSGGEYAIAVSAIVAVLGMILLVPVVVVGLAKLAGRLPLPLRYAVRDAARHRTRTVPAVAAVAATVAGVVALGIANASDAEESVQTYTPILAAGQASLTTWEEEPDWDSYRAVAARYLPDATVTPVTGVPTDGPRHWTEVRFRIEGAPRMLLSGWSSSLGTSVPVSTDGSLPAGVTGLTRAQRKDAEAALSAGGAVVFTDQAGVEGDEATVVAEESRRGSARERATVPAAVIAVTSVDSRFLGVLSQQAASAVGIEPATVGLLVDGADISEDQERSVQEGLAAVSPDVGFYVERGPQNDDQTMILLLVLGALGGVLVLGGTLTATFLSLADARPDLATLSAVGASPRTRRGVAAAYAAVIGVVGAVLGAAVGFVPGVAVTFPLTSQYAGTCTMTGSGACTGLEETVGPFLDVPWLLIGTLVLALPLVTAAVVGLATRSRLPLVARID